MPTDTTKELERDIMIYELSKAHLIEPALDNGDPRGGWVITEAGRDYLYWLQKIRDDQERADAAMFAAMDRIKKAQH
jgi:hypothetical protein